LFITLSDMENLRVYLVHIHIAQAYCFSTLYSKVICGLPVRYTSCAP
jgi:hypothetical protein